MIDLIVRGFLIVEILLQFRMGIRTTLEILLLVNQYSYGIFLINSLNVDSKIRIYLIGYHDIISRMRTCNGHCEIKTFEKLKC
jgi:hypothetical protein